MLAGDKQLVEVLRGIKSAVLNVEIATGVRGEGLSDEAVITVLQKESKKRGDAIELYENAGQTERAAKERYEQEVMSKYLPEMMGEEELEAIVLKTISGFETPPTKQQMGQVISKVKQEVGGRADGALIARLVQKNLA